MYSVSCEAPVTNRYIQTIRLNKKSTASLNEAEKNSIKRPDETKIAQRNIKNNLSRILSGGFGIKLFLKFNEECFK